MGEGAVKREEVGLKSFCSFEARPRSFACGRRMTHHYGYHARVDTAVRDADAYGSRKPPPRPIPSRFAASAKSTAFAR